MMVRRFVSIVTLLLTATFVLWLPLSAQGQATFWVKYSGNPVLTPTPGTWDADSVTQPRVIFDQSIFKMWYVGSSLGIIGIGYATSSDGITWAKHPGPVLSTGQAGTWDSASLGLGSVMWNGTHFVMYYRGAGLTSFQNGAIGLAYSTDGVSWVKYARNPVLRPAYVDARLISSPYVVKEPQIYNMWYAARSLGDPPNSQLTRIIYATSFDGINWARYSAAVVEPSESASAFDSGSVFSPTVIYDGTTYGMWYTAFDAGFLIPQIGYATAKDVTVWSKFENNPLLVPGQPGSWDAGGVENQCVLSVGSKFIMFYDGFSQRNPPEIGFAESPTGFQIPEFPLGFLNGAFAVLLLCVLLLFNRFSPKHIKFMN